MILILLIHSRFITGPEVNSYDRSLLLAYDVFNRLTQASFTVQDHSLTFWPRR
jgi:hypothetical protein